ncbi:MAG: prevent-host-death protein [Anaerolineae bacterium]|nr:prevent-host-death protein [Anaerolineae bacterium]
MERYTLRDAQPNLEKLIDDAQQGKTVLIMDEQQREVRLVPVTESQGAGSRLAGSAKGLICMAEDFDAPLPDF